MLTLERKVLVGFFASLLALVSLAGLTWYFSQLAVEAARYVAHTHRVIASVEELKSQLSRADAAHRGYLLADNPVFLEERDEAVVQINREIKRLSSLSEDNPAQQLRFSELRREILNRLTSFERLIEVRDNQGTAALQTELMNTRSIVLRIRSITDEIRDEEERLLAERSRNETQRMASAQAGFLGLMIFLALALPLLYLRIRHDIAQRRQSEGALKQLTEILDNTPDIVAMFDRGGKLTYSNNAARSQLGMDGQLAGPLGLEQIYPPAEHRKIIDNGMPSAAAMGSWTGETALLAGEGKAIPVSQVMIAHRQPDGLTRFSIIARSIADRKEAERLLQEAAKYDVSNAQVLSLFNTDTDRKNVLQGVLRLLAGSHGMPVSAFYLYEEWGGLLRLEAAHGTPSDMQPSFRLGEGMVGEAAEDMQPIHLAPMGAFDAGLAIETGFGRLIPRELLFSPVAYRGQLLGVLAIAALDGFGERDRSFIERLSSQLGTALNNMKQLEDMKLLAEQLRVRSKEIEQKNRQVEQASRMKSDFLANMSHELRTPLNAIIGFSEVIRDGMAGDVTPEQREYADDILSSGKHLLSLINDILDLSKIESGHMSLDLDQTDAEALAASGLSVLKEKALAHRVNLLSRVEHGAEPVFLDIRKGKQIIYNLLSNAVKFTPDGGRVELIMRKTSRDEIDSWLGRPGVRLFALQDRQFEQFLEISVSDTGIGIAEADLQRLFEPFTQIDSSHTRKYEGTGLGLVMIRRLAELHGGAVMARSVPGAGSTFTVWLPWREQAPGIETPAVIHAPALIVSAEAVAKSCPSPDGESLVLVVEDDPQAAKLLRMHLENEGYRVIHAPNAETGLRLAEERKPCAIVLDIMLPGMDGWQMLTRIKQTRAIADIPVVILSLTDNASRGFALGASQVLTKPITQDELMSALSSLGFTPAQHANVLVADDDPKAVSLISLHLNAAGFTPIGAYGGREAIEIAMDKKPELVVLDLMMPDVSGFDVMQALHQNPGTADIPIIILTAKILTQEDRDRLNGKVQRIIEKSRFDPAILFGEVRRAMARNAGKPALRPGAEA